MNTHEERERERERGRERGLKTSLMHSLRSLDRPRLIVMSYACARNEKRDAYKARSSANVPNNVPIRTRAKIKGGIKKRRATSVAAAAPKRDSS